MDVIGWAFINDFLLQLNFLHLDGPAKLVNILRRFQYEHLLVKTTQALLQLLSCNQCALAITDAGGIDVLHMRLDHPSQRLILASLECLRNLSDVPTGDRDMSQLLTKLLQLLGMRIFSNQINLLIRCERCRCGTILCVYHIEYYCK
jgi:hypothetical protein